MHHTIVNGLMRYRLKTDGTKKRSTQYLISPFTIVYKRMLIFTSSPELENDHRSFFNVNFNS